MSDHSLENGKIGVVTVTYNSAAVIEGFMASLMAQTYTNIIVYVVDNASKDNTLKLLKAYPLPQIRVIANCDNQGVAGANNQGISAALADGCDYVLLINNDVEFPPDLFSGMAESIERYRCDMLVPKIYFHENRNMIWCAGGRLSPGRAHASFHDGEGQIDRGQFDISRPITYAPTCCMLIRKSVFDRIGIMDEKYFVYYDDTDFCLRALKAGIILYYEHSLSLTHKVSSLTGGDASPFYVRYMARNRTYYTRKHFAFPASWFWLAAYQVNLALRILRRKDSLGTYHAKQKAFYEGTKVRVEKLTAS